MDNDDLEIVKALVYYHSKEAPLHGDDNHIDDIKLIALEKKLSGLPRYPYFTLVALLRCVDAMDVGAERCGRSPLDRYIETRSTMKKDLPPDTAKHYRKQIFHYIKHGCILDLELSGLDSNDKETLGCSVTYYPDLLQPSFLVFYAFSKADFDIQDEVRRLGNHEVRKHIEEELGQSINFVKVKNTLAGAKDSLLDAKGVEKLRKFVKRIYHF
jgi:hypothetical protein